LSLSVSAIQLVSADHQGHHIHTVYR
jgi:hypothetical protein